MSSEEPDRPALVLTVAPFAMGLAAGALLAQSLPAVVVSGFALSGLVLALVLDRLDPAWGWLRRSGPESEAGN